MFFFIRGRVNIDMTELSRLIARLQRGINRGASYISSLRHPHLLVASLQELNDLIGNDKVKDSVATQVSHLIMVKRRSLENSSIKEDEVMLNTVLYGPPGVGKTLVGTKLAKIWYSLGYLDGSRNSKEKKQELGEMIKDLFKENGGFGASGTSDDTTLTIYVLFIFIVVFITLLSMAWSFYTKFGGLWTVFVISMMLLIILGVGYYVSASLNNSNNSNNANNANINNIKAGKDAKGPPCIGKDCPNNAGKPVDPKNPPGIHNLNETGQYGGIPTMVNLPSDSEIITIVSRADFVDKFVGWSDKKTIKLLQENLGKVVFVDEAYSLVTDMHDSFGMEVLTAINLFISQHSKEIIVIFAGYKDLMESSIFSFQPGLRRRFMWQFDCNGYTEDQMFDIFKMQLNKKGWELSEEEETRELFSQNMDAFPSFGGDTERLAFFAELEHSRDFISNEKGMSINRLTADHVRRGIMKLQENNIQSNPDEESSNPMVNMMKLFKGNKKQDKKPSQSNQSNQSNQSSQSKQPKYIDRSTDPEQSELDADDLDMIQTVRNSAADRAYH